MQTVIDQFTVQRDVDIVYRETNAGVAGISKWVLGLTYSDVELQTSSVTDTNATIVVSANNSTWTVYAKQIEWNGDDSLYYL